MGQRKRRGSRRAAYEEPEDDSSMRRDICIIIGCLAFFFFTHQMVSSPTVQREVERFAGHIATHPVEGGAFYVLLSVGITVSGIPFGLVDMAAASVYPFPVALCMLFAAKTIGSCCCFAIARSGLLPDRIRRTAMGNSTVRRVQRRIHRSPVYFGTLIRLASVPAVVKNYGLALLDIPFYAFITACVTGSCIYVPMQAVMGRQFIATLGWAVAVKQQTGLESQISAAGAIIGVLALGAVMRQVVSVLLARNDSDDEATEDDTAEAGSESEALPGQTKEQLRRRLRKKGRGPKAAEGGGAAAR